MKYLQITKSELRKVADAIRSDTKLLVLESGTFPNGDRVNKVFEIVQPNVYRLYWASERSIQQKQNESIITDELPF